MKSIIFQMSDSFDMDEKEVALFPASKLYEQGKLSWGQAAEIVGLSKHAFAELLGNLICP